MDSVTITGEIVNSKIYFLCTSKDETLKTSYLSHDNFIFTVYEQRSRNVRFSFFMVIVKVHLSSWIEQKISSTKL